MSACGLFDFWPYKGKQTLSLRSPIAFFFTVPYSFLYKKSTWWGPHGCKHNIGYVNRIERDEKNMKKKKCPTPFRIAYLLDKEWENWPTFFGSRWWKRRDWLWNCNGDQRGNFLKNASLQGVLNSVPPKKSSIYWNLSKCTAFKLILPSCIDFLISSNQIWKE